VFWDHLALLPDGSPTRITSREKGWRRRMSEEGQGRASSTK